MTIVREGATVPMMVVEDTAGKNAPSSGNDGKPISVAIGNSDHHASSAAEEGSSFYAVSSHFGLSYDLSSNVTPPLFRVSSGVSVSESEQSQESLPESEERQKRRRYYDIDFRRKETPVDSPLEEFHGSMNTIMEQDEEENQRR